VVFAEHAAAGQGVLVQFAGRLVLPQDRQDLGFLLGPGTALHRHVHRERPAAGGRARSHAVPARSTAANRRVRAARADVLHARARAGLQRARPGAAHAATPAPAAGLPGRRAAPPPRPPAQPLGRTSCCTWSRPGIPTPRSPASWASLREPCAPTWKTPTRSWVSPAAPPPSPAPSPTTRCTTRRAPPGQQTNRPADGPSTGPLQDRTENGRRCQSS